MCVMLVKDWHRRRSADSTAKRFKSVVFCLSNITSMKFRYGPREEEQKKNEMWAGLDTKETDGQILRTYNTAKLSKKNTRIHTRTHVFCTNAQLWHVQFQQSVQASYREQGRDYICVCVRARVCVGDLSLRVLTFDQAGFKTVSFCLREKVCDFCAFVYDHIISWHDHSLSLRKIMLGSWKIKIKPIKPF